MLLKSDVLDVVQHMPSEFSLGQLIDTIASSKKSQTETIPSREVQGLGWEMLVESFFLFSDDFMVSRNQPPQQTRSLLEF